MDSNRFKYGIVFCGGGTKGAYQIGVWKRLKKLELLCQRQKQTAAALSTSYGNLYFERQKLWTAVVREFLLISILY